MTGRRPSFFIVLPLLLCACLPAASVEIPADTASNCVQGVFGKNPLVTLKEISVPAWPEVRGRDKIDLVTATFDFRETGNPATEEKVAVVFTVTDQTGETRITNPLKGLASTSGTLRLQWNLRDRSGKRVGDGIYRVKVDVFAKNHGNLLTDAVFPLYIASAAPELSDPKISPSKAVLEYGGGPGIGFTLNATARVVVAELTAEGREIDRTERVFGAGAQTIRGDLKSASGGPMQPGEYLVKVSANNPLGESETFVYRYTIVEPPPLDLSLALERVHKLQARDDTVIPFTLTLNQAAYVTVLHINEDGEGAYIGKSTPARPAVLYRKGRHKLEWRRLNRETNTRYTSGTHYFRATAATMAGEEITVESDPVKLDAGPTRLKAGTAGAEQPMVERLAIRKRPSVSVAVSPEILVLGDDTAAEVAYSLNRKGHAVLTLRDGEKVLETLLDTRRKKDGESMLEPGVRSLPLPVSRLGAGSYRVVLEVEAEGYPQTVDAVDLLTVVWRD